VLPISPVLSPRTPIHSLPLFDLRSRQKPGSVGVTLTPCQATAPATDTGTQERVATVDAPTTTTCTVGPYHRALASSPVAAMATAQGRRRSNVSVKVAGQREIARHVREWGLSTSKTALLTPVVAPSTGKCPIGPSWFTSPSSSNTVHSQWTECSDAGSCDRNTGQCSCNTQFEGAACEHCKYDRTHRLSNAPGVSRLWF